MKKLIKLSILIVALATASCTSTHMMSYSILTTSNNNLNIHQSGIVEVAGHGKTLDKATINALHHAGKGYDVLISGQVSFTELHILFWHFASYQVVGIPYNYKDMREEK